MPTEAIVQKKKMCEIVDFHTFQVEEIRANSRQFAPLFNPQRQLKIDQS
jgi:hypothetical protein